MKKICVLCMLILVIITSSVLAASNIDTDRWFWVASNDKETWYIDKQTIEYRPETDSCLLWVLRDVPDMKVIAKVKAQIFYTQNKIDQKEYIIYEYGSTIPVESGTSNNNSINIAPDTMGETLKNKSLTLINRDEELAEYKKQQENEAKQAEQERKDEKKEQRNKEIANTAIGIIGGLF